jgi:hypothetical protein
MWVSDVRSETSSVVGVNTIFAVVTGEVVAVNTVEVAVKELKQISTGLARMSAMLAGKTTPNRGTMLHSEFPISPTWRDNC